MKLADILLVGMVLWVFISGGPDKSKVEPVKPAVTQGALKTAITFETLYADLLEDTATRLGKGEFQTATVLKTHLQQRTAQAWNIGVRDGIATEMANALNTDYSPEKAAALMKDWAAQLRKHCE